MRGITCLLFLLLCFCNDIIPTCVGETLKLAHTDHSQGLKSNLMSDSMSKSIASQMDGDDDVDDYETGDDAGTVTDDATDDVEEDGDKESDESDNTDIDTDTDTSSPSATAVEDGSEGDVEDTATPSVSPADDVTDTAAPSLPPVEASDTPTLVPTALPTSLPTPRPIAMTVPPTLAPTRFPTHAPFTRPLRTGAPSALPTENALLAQLRYPDEFSSTMTTGVLSFVAFVAVCWVLLSVFYVGRKHGYISLPSDKAQLLAATKAKAQKNRVKKFEDYWENDTTEDSVSKFPNRAANAAASTNTFDDYWDDIEFSTHSTDGFNISRNL